MTETTSLRGVLVALFVVVCTLAVSTVCALEAPISVDVHQPSAETPRDVPLTFGQVFRRGAFTAAPAVRAGGDTISAQVDVQRRHDDGSIRFAAVSVVVPKIPAGQRTTLHLVEGRGTASSRPPITVQQLLATKFDARVVFRLTDGTTLHADARDLLSAEKVPRTWLSGPVASEWIASGPPVDARGEPDADLRVQFSIRAYAGCRQVRVSAVVENCLDSWAGNIGYDVAIEIGGREVFREKAVDHRRLSRWRQTFWWGSERATVHVEPDIDYLLSTGALPNYDTTLESPPPSWAERDVLERFETDSDEWRILGRGPLTAYMPTTGGRLEIAPYPAWTVRYLLTKDPRWRAFVLRAGDLAGSWPIHVRGRASQRVLTIDERPRFWLDARGKDRPEWKGDRSAPRPGSAGSARLTPDMAHQPSLAYVPYLLTGDRYYLEEACFWAGYCLLNTWDHPRRGAEGILAGQIRGNAWSLRNIADAAWIARDGDPERRYFDAKLRNNIADRVRRMLGPPEYNAMGFWGPRTTQSARIPKPANPAWMVMAPWEHDYLIWSLHHLVELGWTDAARPRDFLLRWRVGMLTHPDAFDPRMAAPYRFVVGEKTPQGDVRFYDDWQRIARENLRLYAPGLPQGGGTYTYSARAAVICGVDGGFPRAEFALRALDALLPDRRRDLAGQPYWAIRSR